jgi:hypothetical protein
VSGHVDNKIKKEKKTPHLTGYVRRGSQLSKERKKPPVFGARGAGVGVRHWRWRLVLALSFTVGWRLALVQRWRWHWSGLHRPALVFVSSSTPFIIWRWCRHLPPISCHCCPVGGPCWWTFVRSSGVGGESSPQLLLSEMGPIITLRAGARSGDVGAVLASFRGYNIVRT